MKYSIRGGWTESTHITPPERLGRPQCWPRISPGTRPTLAGVFLSSLAVIPLVESDSSLEAAALQHLHPVLDGLQADRHLGQHADGLLLRFGLFKAGNDI